MNNVEPVLTDVNHIVAAQTIRGRTNDDPLPNNYITTLLGDISDGEFIAEIERVKARRAKLVDHLGIERLVIPREYQTHAIALIDEQVDIGHDDRLMPHLKADALWTTTRGLGLAASIADCAGILVADTTQELIAAIHSGHAQSMRALPWRTIKQLPADPANLKVYVSPMASAESYEVQPEFKANFVQYFDRHFPDLGLNPDNYFTERELSIWPARHSLQPINKQGIGYDNRQMVVDQLLAAGVREGNITVDARNSMDPANYLHSGRIDTYKRNVDGNIAARSPGGGQLSVISLKLK